MGGIRPEVTESLSKPWSTLRNCANMRQSITMMTMDQELYHLGVKALIKNTEGSILLLQVNPEKLSGNQPAYWDLPGGRVEKDQTIAATLQREIQEETGVTDISGISEVGMVLSNIRIPVSDDLRVGLILAVYSCTVPDDAIICISDEHMAFQWYQPLDAAKLLQHKYPSNFCDVIAAV